MQDLRLAQDRIHEQRAEEAQRATLSLPQPIDPEVLRQIGGGITEAPGHGW